MALRPWKLISSHQEHSFSVFSVRKDRARSPRTGEDHDFVVLEAPSWVNVIPLTSRDDVVMVRQYRHGIRDFTLEIPGGVIEKNETPEEAARKELLEETGYQAPSMTLLGTVHPNPAILDNTCYTYLAENVVKAGNPSLDEKEDVEVVTVPLAEIPHLIETGGISHALIVVALAKFFAQRRF